MKDILIGIDPGKSGCLCFWCPNGFDDTAILKSLNNVVYDETFLFYDWPSNDNISDVAYVLDSLYYHYNYKGSILEKVSAMPGQGVTSMFSFGKNFGIWQGLLTAFKIPYLLLTPGQWRKGLVTKTDGADAKKAVYNVCSKLFPTSSRLLKGPKGGYKDGRGDAMLLAYVAASKFNNALGEDCNRVKKDRTK